MRSDELRYRRLGTGAAAFSGRPFCSRQPEEGLTSRATRAHIVRHMIPSVKRLSLLSAVTTLLIFTACTSGPTLVPTPRAGTPVKASFGRTWAAAVDVVAERSATVRTIDRPSGLIIAGDIVLGDSTSRWADCGHNSDGPFPPVRMTYNVVVRGDSTSSNIKINAFWASTLLGPVGDCVSRGVWEAQTEALVKAKAEGGK